MRRLSLVVSLAAIVSLLPLCLAAAEVHGVWTAQAPQQPILVDVQSAEQVAHSVGALERRA